MPPLTGIWPVGAQYTISVNVTDANWQTMQASANITTETTSVSSNQPTTCTVFPITSFNQMLKHCDSSAFARVVTSGVASSP